MLVVDGHTLEPVDVLDLVDQVVGEFLHAFNGKDIVRRRVTVINEFALFHAITVLHRQALAPRDQVLRWLFLVVVRFDYDPLLILVVLAELDRAGDFRNDGVILWPARLE